MEQYANDAFEVGEFDAPAVWQRESGCVPQQNYAGRSLFLLVTPKYETLHKVSRSLAVGTESRLRMITGNVTCA